jgi:protocatechuate 3,4-dioxygenase beta subunit
MTSLREFEWDRRMFLRTLFLAPFAAMLGPRAAGALLLLPATPSTPDDDHDQALEPTHSETAGPFFKPRSPERTSLMEKGITGTPLAISGRVRGRDGKPVAGALLDFWHADDDGEYDNEGFRLRGHQYADELGRYRLDSVVPGVYPGRTRHIHVRVQAPHGKVLTTQLYFPGEPRNRGDGLFDESLLVSMRESVGHRVGSFDFVLGDR